MFFVKVKKLLFESVCFFFNKTESSLSFNHSVSCNNSLLFCICSCVFNKAFCCGISLNKSCLSLGLSSFNNCLSLCGGFSFNFICICNCFCKLSLCFFVGFSHNLVSHTLSCEQSGADIVLVVSVFFNSFCKKADFLYELAVFFEHLLIRIGNDIKKVIN